jgi:hypothetical protein
MRWPKACRLPTFRTAFIGSIAVLLAFAAWAFFDASFSVVLGPSSWTNLWRILGPRLLLFAVLALIGVACAVLVVYRQFFGDRQGRSLRSLLLVVALASMWMGLCVSYNGLAEAGLRWRIRRMLPGLKQDASILLAKWPTTDGELPFSGKYVIDKDRPDLLVSLWAFGPYADMFPFGETVAWIVKLDHGRLMIGVYPLVARIARVEYRPDETKPNPLVSPDDTLSVVELEPHWFLLQGDFSIWD